MAAWMPRRHSSRARLSHTLRALLVAVPADSGGVGISCLTVLPADVPPDPVRFSRVVVTTSSRRSRGAGRLRGAGPLASAAHLREVGVAGAVRDVRQGQLAL